MNILKSFIIPIILATRSLRSNPVRTFLSLLGIVIGVVAVVMVFSLGAGLKDYVLGQVEMFGSDVIEIEIKVPKTKQVSSENATGIATGIQITTFKLDDAREVSELSNLGAWYAGSMGQEIAEYRGKNERVMIFGTTEGVLEADEQLKLASGEMYSKSDNESVKQVIVLGSKIKEELFGNNKAVGEKIKLGGNSYRVIGVLESRGSTGFFDFDSLVYIPVKTLQKKLMGIDHIQFAIYKVEDMAKVELTTAMMTQKMRDLHNIKNPEDDDFAVISMKEAMEMIETVFAVINILLLALTSISLLVGGVGIMNVMYVSVTERTSEIGLRKALGARKKDILRQFLIEAIFITLLGGVIGIILGFVFSKLAEYIAFRYNFILEFPLSIEAILAALAFSVLTGIIFGIRPAWKASKLSPIEALNRQ